MAEPFFGSNSTTARPTPAEPPAKVVQHVSGDEIWAGYTALELPNLWNATQLRLIRLAAAAVRCLDVTSLPLPPISDAVQLNVWDGWAHACSM